jgi:hypothetical protein
LICNIKGETTQGEVFVNRVLRKIFEAKRDEVTGEWRKLQNEEIHGLFSSPIITVISKGR